MASLLSRKKLNAALIEMGRLPAGHDYKKLSNEVYGKDAFIYFDAATVEARRPLESALVDKGFRVDRAYSPTTRTLAVQVSYFKGECWDE